MSVSDAPLEEKLETGNVPAPNNHRRFLRGRRLVSQVVLLVIVLLTIHHASSVANAVQRLLPWNSLLSLSKLDAENAPSIGAVSWHDCVGIAGVECGSIVVPLDYFNLTKGTSTIAIGRYKATKFPKKGTIFLNPGGPGGPGVDLVKLAGPMIAAMTGPYYDLVGFDPRGIGETTPKVQCFANPLARHIFSANTVLEQSFTVSTNLSDPAARDELVAQQREFLAMKKAQAELCAVNMGESLRYMGTATVARDIDFMTRVLEGQDALINFWGVSYGSILGAYLVNMFPDRVGRVSIDGIANPVLWADKPSHFWHQDWISSSEDTFQVFFKACSEAGPASCPLANSTNEDPVAIGQRIDRFLDDLYENPLPVPHALRPGFLKAGAVRALLLIFVQRPRIWPDASALLASAMAGNGTGLLNLLLPSYADIPLPDYSPSTDLTRLAVTCLDSPPPKDKSEFPTAEQLADIGMETLRDVSPHFGVNVGISEPDGGCQFWPARGPERFVGPWNHTLRNPMLIVSNTADPITPIASGRLVNRLMRNSSRLLIVKSPGHCSIALPSLCVMKVYQAYFTNGTLPPNEYECDVDVAPFPDLDKATFDLSAKDENLLKAAAELGDELMKIKLHSRHGA